MRSWPICSSSPSPPPRPCGSRAVAGLSPSEGHRRRAGPADAGDLHGDLEMRFEEPEVPPDAVGERPASLLRDPDPRVLGELGPALEVPVRGLALAQDAHARGEFPDRLPVPPVVGRAPPLSPPHPGP